MVEIWTSTGKGRNPGKYRKGGMRASTGKVDIRASTGKGRSPGEYWKGRNPGEYRKW